MPHARLILFVIAVAACLTPWVGPAIALVLGAGLTLTIGAPFEKKRGRWSKDLLKLSVMGLGFGIAFWDVIRQGGAAVGYTAVSIAVVFGFGWLLGRLFKPDKNTGILITAGTAICGGSAIAAITPVIRAKEHQAGVALATVFTLNAVALLIFPWIGKALDLSRPDFGVWAAIAIHDTSSVVGACGAYDNFFEGAADVALPIGTTVKLARAIWILPLAFLIGWTQKSEAKPKFPLFLLGFVAASALRSFIPEADAVWDWVYLIARRVLVLTIFLIGTGLTRKVLKDVGARPFAFAILLWLAMSLASLGAVMAGIIPIPQQPETAVAPVPDPPPPGLDE